MATTQKPVVLITGVSGKIGTALAENLKDDYTVAGMDLDCDDACCQCVEADLTSPDSIALALRKFEEDFGNRIASVIHLAAYFDFTGEEHPLYRKLNVDGTKLLLEELQRFEVEQFVYSGTMLIHEACRPGERIDENTPIAPKWAYPESKAAAEDAIREARGDIPAVLFRLAGVYDDESAVPTLSHQIARIYERSVKSRFYAGDAHIGQSLIHQDDLVGVIHRAIDRRASLPDEIEILAGEPDAMGYGALQDEIGRLIHGEEEWRTLTVPPPMAKTASWVETKTEAIVPDDFDKGEKPFIRPFMIDMANDHYALDISRAEELLDWRPQHDIRETLPRMIDALKTDPHGWYEKNGITPPDWLEVAENKSKNPEKLRAQFETRFLKQHHRYLWAHFINMAVGLWLLTTPTALDTESTMLAASNLTSGAAVFIFSLLSLSPRLSALRWATAAVGIWISFAPLAFWAPTAASYLNGTLTGGLVIGLAILTPPTPGVAPTAALTGPTKPEGWNFSPSSWSQRLPIIFLACIGLLISRHLAAYQLGYIDSVWEPFFAGTSAAKNGTEEIITSAVSEAWPVPDAGLGGLVYMLEILTGILGSTRRWRTMPWLVLLFGFLIVPLGVVSITFIIIQPILIGTWCTLCLIGAAAMLLQIPYSLDELAATTGFLWRRYKAGRPILRVLLFGDTDDGGTRVEEDEFERPYATIFHKMWTTSITLPWNSLLSLLIGISLMFTRPLFGTEGGMANADHLIGSLVVTITVISFAELARIVRFLNIPFGVALLITPFVFAADWPATAFSVTAGIALVVLSIRRGPVQNEYGPWNKIIV